MDLRVKSVDGSAWIDCRDFRPVDDTTYRGRLQFLCDAGPLAREFWFDRYALTEFVREATWARRSLSGEAELARAESSDRLRLVRDAQGWHFALDLIDLAHAPDGTLRVAIDVDDLEATAVIDTFARLASASA